MRVFRSSPETHAASPPGTPPSLPTVDLDYDPVQDGSDVNAVGWTVPSAGSFRTVRRIRARDSVTPPRAVHSATLHRFHRFVGGPELQLTLTAADVAGMRDALIGELEPRCAASVVQLTATEDGALLLTKRTSAALRDYFVAAFAALLSDARVLRVPEPRHRVLLPPGMSFDDDTAHAALREAARAFGMVYKLSPRGHLAIVRPRVPTEDLATARGTRADGDGTHGAVASVPAQVPESTAEPPVERRRVDHMSGVVHRKRFTHLPWDAAECDALYDAVVVERSGAPRASAERVYGMLPCGWSVVPFADGGWCLLDHTRRRGMRVGDRHALCAEDTPQMVPQRSSSAARRYDELVRDHVIELPAAGTHRRGGCSVIGEATVDHVRREAVFGRMPARGPWALALSRELRAVTGGFGAAQSCRIVPRAAEVWVRCVRTAVGSVVDLVEGTGHSGTVTTPALDLFAAAFCDALLPEAAKLHTSPCVRRGASTLSERVVQELVRGTPAAKTIAMQPAAPAPRVDRLGLLRAFRPVTHWELTLGDERTWDIGARVEVATCGLYVDPTCLLLLVERVLYVDGAIEPEESYVVLGSRSSCTRHVQELMPLVWQLRSDPDYLPDAAVGSAPWCLTKAHRFAYFPLTTSAVLPGEVVASCP